ncbi:MAG: NAD(P)-binding domain-containing protein, partial [Nitrospira sp.]|nr:NAD(P)-binding domain-containing protein [Nitrospira sp.]
MSHIAFIGTGLLGSAFAEAAARRGDQVTAWNRSPEKAAALAELGVRALPTPGEAVRDARRIHLVLKDDAVVEEVVASFRANVSPDAVIIDHTTTLPTLTAERSTRFNGEGLHYLHCPVFMGPPAARNSGSSVNPPVRT